MSYYKVFNKKSIAKCFVRLRKERPLPATKAKTRGVLCRAMLVVDGH